MIEGFQLATSEDAGRFVDYKVPKHTRFEPQLWADSSIDGVTGPYAYALDLPFIGMCPPGELSSNTIYDESPIPNERHLNELNLRQLFERDGLVHVSKDCVPRDNCHVIAVRYTLGTENEQPSLAILRRDQDGTWSYKHSFGYKACNDNKSVLNTDSELELITDPEKANLAKLTEFVGYFAAPYDGILYRPRVHIPEHIWPMQVKQSPNLALRTT